jgi:hypothetical protein
MKRLRFVGFFALGFLLLFGATEARAHAFRPALLSMDERDGGEIDVLWKEAPELLEQALLNPRFPTGCREQSNAPDSATGSRFIHLQCGPQGLAGQTVRVDGIEAAKVDVVWRYSRAGQSDTGLLRGDAPEVTLPGGPSNTKAGATGILPFVQMGIGHILGGVDHLLFVLTLLLLVSAWRTLLATVTAFTAAHSLTLTAGVLGWVHAPQPLVEALILLSILVVAAEAARPLTGGDALAAHRQKPWRFAFVFGLIHGFGFAGALGDLGIARTDIPLALAGFNVGVEIGQILFIGAALALLALARGLGAGARHRTALAYGIGSVAMAWMLERISQF